MTLAIVHGLATEVWSLRRVLEKFTGGFAVVAHKQQWSHH
jgi:hypothetical protein